MRLRSFLSRLALPALFAIGVSPLAAAAQQGSVTGRVTDASTGQPIAAAQVSLVGTNIGTLTNSDGRYTMRNVAAGSHVVRVLRVGFVEQRQPVTVGAAQQATVDLALRPAPITLSPVVTTATGDQRRVEVGNAIANVDAASIVQQRAITGIADVLTSRAAGVMVVPGNQVGAGTRVRIRGLSSYSLTNNPIYVVDGVRVEGTTGSSSVSVGGTTASRVNDLNPEEIESIEIVKGPSAATLYGTDAANGVIVIRTKRGVAGAPQWTYYTEQTMARDENTYPTAYRGWRNGSTASNTTQCFLTQVASGACTQDSVTSYNLVADKEATPFGIGYRQQHGLQVRGGSETVRYFIYGEWESDDGVTKVPEFSKRWLAARGLSLRPEEENPNGQTKISTRANLNISLPRNAELSANVGYISSDMHLPQSDDSGFRGIAPEIYGGPGFKYNRHPITGDTLYGWRQSSPQDIYRNYTSQAIERFIPSLSLNWSPIGWLAMRGNVGLDYISRNDQQICRFEECPVNGQDRLGWKTDNRANFYTYTVDLGATATRQLTTSINSKTAAGFQFTRSIFDVNGATGTQLPPGGTTVSSGAIASASEGTDETRTLGGYVEQSLAFADRLFLTGAVRSDRNSAFGRNFKTVFYPKFSASYVISQEGFFPKWGWVDQLRLRTAYGASGVQPGTNSAIRYFSSSTTAGESGDQPALVLTALGNDNLKPERSAELEIGFDGNFWNNRISTELTYYDKKSTDALVSRILPPSLGTGNTSRFENLGSVRNWGWEMLVNAQLLQKRALGWDVTINGSSNSNELVSLGDVPPIIGTTTRQVPGYPLNGHWQRALLGYNDANGDRIIVRSEIQVSDSVVYHGYAVPRHEVAVTNGFDFLNRKLRLAAMLDYKGGHKTYNNTERIRCASRNNCRGLIDPTAPLFEQARTVLVRELGVQSGFFEDADFIRFRELALTFTPSDNFVSRYTRGRNATITLAARNLGIVWTKYTGVDPEAFGTTGDAPSEFQAFPPPTYYSLRFTFGL